MFYIVRLIFICISLCMFFIICRFFHTQFSKQVKFSCVCLVLLITFLSSIFPVEDYFLSFSTVDRVFQYRYKGTLEYMIEGKNSCMLFYSTGKSTTSIAFIAKEDNYQIGNWFSKNTIYTGMWNGYTFKIYQYGNEDYYILVSGFLDDAENVVIKDKYDSVFVNTLNDTDVDNYIRYAAYIPNLEVSNYTITINGLDVNLVIS